MTPPRCWDKPHGQVSDDAVDPCSKGQSKEKTPAKWASTSGLRIPAKGDRLLPKAKAGNPQVPRLPQNTGTEIKLSHRGLGSSECGADSAGSREDRAEPEPSSAVY